MSLDAIRRKSLSNTLYAVSSFGLKKKEKVYLMTRSLEMIFVQVI